jgi:phosphate/phosphite/phosphonate ABC transporter binding protein
MEKEPDAPFLVFGYAAPEASDEAKRAMTELATLIGQMTGVDLAVSALPSYERVTQLIHKGKIDVAWISPIPYIALARNERVTPLASPRRGGLHYHGAIIVSASSPISGLPDLKGKRAAWVDRYSAAGFVVPRIELVKAGLDIKSAFSSQRFYGSHEAVVRAVADGIADLGATFVRLAENGAVIGGPWSKTSGLEERLRIFATFGEIPPDVIVARVTLEAAIAARIKDGLTSLATDPRGKELLQTVFGADALVAPQGHGYEELRAAAAAAVQEKLLDIDEELDPEIVFDPNADQTLKMKIQG